MLLDLDALYDEYNTRYFGGKLPKVPVRWGRVQESSAAEFWPDSMEIVIHPMIRRCGLDKYARILLLHEMVHVKLRNKRIADHGRLFHTEMKRLARIGALVKLW